MRGSIPVRSSADSTETDRPRYILSMLRTLLEKAELWLTRVGHFDLLVIKTGLGGLIMTGASGVIIGALAWLHQAPLYQVILAGMIGMGAALFIANQSLRLVTSWKMPQSISRQQARRLDREDPDAIKLRGSTPVVITMLASAFIIVAGLYVRNTYSTWESDIEGTYCL